MADNLSPVQRTAAMRSVKARDTTPEKVVRQLLRTLGATGYRLHRKDIPGAPDIAFVGKKQAIFVNGCFWHGHDCERDHRLPQSNHEYWVSKIERNRQRDARNISALQSLGWGVLIVWECEMHDASALKACLQQFVSGMKRYP